MNREELNKFLGKKVEITLYGTDVTGILNQASDECFEKFSIVGDIWYLLIEETTHQPFAFRYDFDILEYEFQRLKAKETSMLVDYSYKEFADGKLFFCPKCCDMITKSYFYCPTCGQRLIWVNIYDTRTTVEDGENADRKD